MKGGIGGLEVRSAPGFIPIIFIMLLICGAAFSQYSEPPWGDVRSANRNLSLEGEYNDSFATDSLVGVSFPPANPRDFTISSSIQPIGLSSMLDGSVCPRDDVSLLIARGSRIDHLMNNNVYCNAEAIARGFGGLCDFDNDKCPEYENQTIIDYRRVSVDFIFKDADISVPLSSTIPVPDEILSAMQDSSGSDNLTVSIHGNVLIAYQLDNPTRSGSDCVDSFYFANGSIPISRNFTYKVYGSNRLFFLKAPLLREQWFRDNMFDVVVLSQVPLYNAMVRLNGNQIANATLKRFNITSGPYGLLQLQSIPANVTLNQTNTTGSLNPINQTNQTNQTNSTNQSSSANQTLPPAPIPLRWSEFSNSSFIPSPIESENRPFLFVYEFSTAYDGLGPNNLSLSFSDACGGSGTFNESLLSRMLSYNGNLLENGSPIDLNISRGSVPFNEDILNRTQISLGLVAVIVFLAFMNFWALK